MGLFTRSQFFYGHNVTNSNFTLDFDEGNGIGPVTAELRVGSYSFDEFADEIARAFNLVGQNTYVTLRDREKRTISIASNTNYDLLPDTGPTVGTSAYPLWGITEEKNEIVHESAPSASQFRPQFLLQNYVSFDDEERATQSVINQSGDGSNVQVVSFGKSNFMTCNIRYQTNSSVQRGGPIEANETGVSDLRDFMQYIRNKRPIEFMEDRDNPDTFTKCILERTPESSSGTAFRLKEQREGLGFFETGRLQFRKL